MKCKNCETNIEEGVEFCPNCGKQAYTESKIQSSVEQKEYGQADTQRIYKKSSNTKDIIRICVGTLVGLAFFALFYFFGTKIFNGSNNKMKTSKVETSVISSELTENNRNVLTTIINEISTANKNTNNNQPATYEYNYNGYVLYVPYKLKCEMNYTDGTVVLSDSNSIWEAQMEIIDGSYQQIKNSINEISDNMNYAFRIRKL